MFVRTLVASLGALLVMATGARGESPAASMRVAELRCEYLADPAGIDVVEPRLSWQLQPTAPAQVGQRQTACQILVASSDELLARDTGDLWDTGKLKSDRSIHVAYAGKNLESRAQLFWKVRAWDENDHPSTWSAPARWSMGLLDPSDWEGAKWIGLDEPDDAVSLADFRQGSWVWFPEGNPAADAPAATRYFRRPFELPDRAKVRSAEFFIAADDAASVFLNGAPVGEAVGNANLVRFELAPGDFRSGRNVLTVAATNMPALVPQNPAAFAASLRVEFQDGSLPPLIITTDDNWRASDREHAKWQEISFDHAAWPKVKPLGGIGAAPWGDPYGETWRPEHRTLPARMVRRSFRAGGEVRRAVATVCGLGFFELYVNGQKIGDRLMDPGLTEYSKRCFYVTFDVTDRVQSGDNALGVILGNGRFYAPRLNVPVPTVSFGYPKLLLNLRLEYADGSSQDIVSDGDWKITSDGPTRTNNEYDGETYDARREQDGWAQSGFDDSQWPDAQLVQPPGGALEAQMIEPIRVTQTLKPVAITEPAPGVFIVDFGQAFYGVPRITARAPGGTRVAMRSSFSLRPNGLLETENDRSALNTDVYIFRGTNQDESWRPRFKGNAIRRVQVSGFPGTPTKENFEGLVVHTDHPPAGEFASSNDLIDRIFLNARWGTRLQNRSIPMEPDRDERQGWSGHPAKTSESEGYNFNVAPFYASWLDSVRLDQHPDGNLQEISPGYWTFNSKGTIWPAIITIIPNWLYDFYGDTRALADNYDAMKRWVLYHVKANQKLDFTLDHHSYDDWVDATRIGMQGVPDSAAATMPMISTAYHYHNLQLVARAAGVLGNEDDRKRFTTLAQRVKDGFNGRFFDAAANRYGDGRQFSYVLPLAFGLVPDAHRQPVIQNLVEQIMVKDAGHTTVGLLGTQWQMQLLTDIGHPEVAYTIATRTTRPSWGYMIANGATTIWERWDTDTQDGGMNGESQKILSGNFEAWCYQTLAGINYDPEQPGFKHILLRPRLVGDLKWVRASHRSMYGDIRSAWQISDDGATSMRWDVTVPPNTTATAYVPTSDPTSVIVGGASGVVVEADKAPGVKFSRNELGAAVYELLPGTYSFGSHWKGSAK